MSIADAKREDDKMFQTHPAPIWESVMRDHPGYINHTCPYLGPMLYWITRIVGALNVLEIGVAQGYSSYFLASGVRDNENRFIQSGMYYGCDNIDRFEFLNPLIEMGLPVTHLITDSVLLTPRDFDFKSLDLIFQDGFHNTDHCLKELELFYPMLKGLGAGYLIVHDAYGPCEEYCNIILADKRYEFEHVRFLTGYGFAILRKMEGYVDRQYWPGGDQKTVVH